MDLQPVGRLIPGLLTALNFIYDMATNMKANKERFQEIARKVEYLEGLVLRFQANGLDRKSHSVKNALEDLSRTLENIKRWMIKYSNYSGIKKLVRSGKYEEKIGGIDRQLQDHFMFLSGDVLATLSAMGNELDRVQQRISTLFDVSGPSLPVVVVQTGPLFDPRSYATPPLNNSIFPIHDVTPNISDLDQFNPFHISNPDQFNPFHIGDLDQFNPFHISNPDQFNPFHIGDLDQFNPFHISNPDQFNPFHISNLDQFNPFQYFYH
ncbi:uncharacterized protein LOC127353586 isoform X2 [Xyrichtys novacula]|uniref:Uncharacterized protein LOC127353586 isoform X2 n=1 Tax=Xyrichtys novacula TaxID=13765 RepID=A0AAV1F4G5_XYRNO|nr:uncharacterized protein LOC127353586 isoform X2 [Xyrichtys novacula]